MNFANFYRPGIGDELKALLRKDSFAYLLQHQIGNELDGIFEPVYEDEIPMPFRAQHLYLLLSSGWNWDHKWVEQNDGTYITDAGHLLPATVPPHILPSELLAIAGLWYLYERFNDLGPLPENDEIPSESGFSRAEILDHTMQCVLIAHQSAICAQKMALGRTLTPEEMERGARIASARKAADARHSLPGGSRDKRAAIHNSWASGKYSSRDVCAEQECAALGMSFSTARKALRGTPDPVR